MKLFQATVSFLRTTDKGFLKRVREAYLTDAMSFTECEAEVTNQIAPFAEEGVDISGIKIVEYAEIVAPQFTLPSGKVRDDYNEQGSSFYELKVRWTVLDEKKGVEKEHDCKVLVVAKDIDQAKERFKERVNGSMADYDIINIKKLKIDEFFHYTPSVSDSTGKEAGRE